MKKQELVSQRKIGIKREVEFSIFIIAEIRFENLINCFHSDLIYPFWRVSNPLLYFSHMSLFLEKPNISVIMPAYNESGNIESVISKAIPVLDTFAEEYEIIVVNDGSTDETKELLDTLAKSNPHLRVVHHPQNHGYGSAIRSGLKESRLDYIFITDSDGQFDFNELTEVYPHIAKTDFIVGYRLQRQDWLMRKINAYCWNVLCQTLFKTGLRDVDCAFKLFKRPILNSIQLKACGSMISTELVVKSRKAGFKILEIGVHHYPRLSGKPTGANFRVILRAFQEIIQLYPELH